MDGKELWLPLANLVSICALLVWFPDNPDDTITRLLFPGSTPQNKVLRGLEKLKEHHPIVGYEDIERKLNEVKMLWKQSLELIDKKKSVILEMERKINDAELGIQNGNDFLERALAERYKRQQRFWIIVAVIVVLGIVGLVLKIIF